MQSSSLNIHLSEYQLKLISDVWGYEQSESKSLQPKLFICLVLSILVHYFFIFGNFSLQTKDNRYLIEGHKSISIQLTKTVNKSKNLRTINNSRQAPSQTDIVKQKYMKPDTLRLKDSQKNSEQSERKKTKHNIQKRQPTTISQSPVEQEQYIDTLRETYLDSDFIIDETSDSTDHNIIIFDPRLRSMLNKIEARKNHIIRINAQNQIRKNNEYFEFKDTGNQRVIRINGNCFSVPKNDPFTLSPKIWSILGSCIQQ